MLTNNVAFIISCSSKFLSEVVEMSICNKHGLLEVFQTTLFRKEVPDYKFFSHNQKILGFEETSCSSVVVVKGFSRQNNRLVLLSRNFFNESFFWLDCVIRL